MDYPGCTLEDIQDDALFMLAYSRDDTKLALLHPPPPRTSPRTAGCKLGGEAAFSLYLFARLGSIASLRLLSTPLHSTSTQPVDSDGWTALSLVILLPPDDMECCPTGWIVEGLKAEVMARCANRSEIAELSGGR